jgi:hypothetical protein
VQKHSQVHAVILARKVGPRFAGGCDATTIGWQPAALAFHSRDQAQAVKRAGWRASLRLKSPSFTSLLMGSLGIQLIAMPWGNTNIALCITTFRIDVVNLLA